MKADVVEEGKMDNMRAAQRDVTRMLLFTTYEPRSFSMSGSPDVQEHHTTFGRNWQAFPIVPQ